MISFAEEEHHITALYEKNKTQLTVKVRNTPGYANDQFHLVVLLIRFDVFT